MTAPGDRMLPELLPLEGLTWDRNGNVWTYDIGNKFVCKCDTEAEAANLCASINVLRAQATLRAGGVWVPVEPTPEMRRAFYDAKGWQPWQGTVNGDTDEAYENRMFATKYRAMLAAAAHPEGAER